MPDEALNQESESQQPDAPADAGSVLDFLYNATENQGDVTADAEVETDEEVDETPEAEETEAEAGDQEADSEASSDESTDDAEEGDEGESIATVSELIEHLEADPEWFNGLKVEVKVNGKSTDVSLQDMVASYQTQEAANDRLAMAKEEATNLRQEATQLRDSVKEEVGVAASLVLVAKQALSQDMQAIEALKETDSEQYLLKKDEVQQKAQALGKLEERVRQELRAAQKPSPEVVQKEYADLVERMPSLEGDDARRDLFKYITDQGITSEQIEANPWHQLYVAFEKARQFDLMQGKQKATKKRIAKIPKMVKPSKPDAAPAPSADDHATILYGNK